MPGTKENPFRIAVIGSGPAGFYAVEQLLKNETFHFQVDLFDKLPTPYGLVRGGVAPDHQHMKSVIKVFEKTAGHSHFQFFGNVELGKNITVADLDLYYHQILFCTGANQSKRLGLEGEDAKGCWGAAEFVAWYNGHPDFKNLDIDFSSKRAVIVGVGNVALDIARVLTRDISELSKTDIADHALEKLKHSQIEEVVLIGRRGSVQSAFTSKEVGELGELEGVVPYTLPEEMELDALSQKELAENNTRVMEKKLQFLQQYSQNSPDSSGKKIAIRFYLSPSKICVTEDGKVKGLVLEKTKLFEKEDGSIGCKSTDETLEMETELIFLSIGYQSRRIEGVAYDEKKGRISNLHGQIVDSKTKEPLVGHFVSGWAKRGASGTIGTNRTDSIETVQKMLEELEQKKHNVPRLSKQEWEAFILQKQPDLVSFTEWKLLDEIETSEGKEQERPRVKKTTVDEMLQVIEEKKKSNP